MAATVHCKHHMNQETQNLNKVYYYQGMLNQGSKGIAVVLILQKIFYTLPNVMRKKGKYFYTLPNEIE